MKADDRKRFRALGKVARHLGLGVTKRDGGFMVFRLVDSALVFGHEPVPYSLSLGDAEQYILRLKERFDRGIRFPWREVVDNGKEV